MGSAISSETAGSRNDGRWLLRYSDWRRRRWSSACLSGRRVALLKGVMWYVNQWISPSAPFALRQQVASYRSDGVRGDGAAGRIFLSADGHFVATKPSPCGGASVAPRFSMMIY